jgi:hypothetical protein
MLNPSIEFDMNLPAGQELAVHRVSQFQLESNLPNWKTMRFTTLTAPCVIDGPMNGNAFLAYVEQVLVPTLKSGDLVDPAPTRSQCHLGRKRFLDERCVVR